MMEQPEKIPPLYWLTDEPLDPVTGGELRYHKHINYLRSSGWTVRCLSTNGKRLLSQLICGLRLGIKLIKAPPGIIIEDTSLRDKWLFLNLINKYKHRIVTFALESFPASENKSISQFLFSRYFQNVHCIIVASKFMNDWVVKMGAKESKIHIVPDAARVKGIDFHFKPIGNPIRIFCAAHIRSNKGQDVLLKALSMLPRNKFQVRFAGYVKEPGYKIKLMEFMKKNYLEDEVVWLGMLKEEELTKEYEAANIFVLPTYREGFGQAILEAMSFGLPVITSKVGAIPELVEHMKSGILVDAGNPKQIADMINLLCSNQKLMDSISENAYTEAVKYGDWNEINSKFENVLQRLSLSFKTI